MKPDTIPTMRTNGRDVDALLGYYAALSELEAAQRVMERRIRTIPGGWRDMRLIQTKMEALGEKITATVPVEKRRNLQRLLPKVRLRVTLGPQACAPGDGLDKMTMIGFDDLDVLVDCARDRCKICAEWQRGKCGRCELGKVLDRVLRYDRKGVDWDRVSDDDIRKE